MASTCIKCSQNVKSLEFVKCNLCDRLVHMKCIGWARSNLDFLNGHANLLWFCDGCLPTLDQLKNKGATPSTETIASAVSDCIEISLKNFKLELDKTNSLIATISEKMQTNSAITLSAQRPGNKRPRGSVDMVTPKRSTTPALLGGTRQVANNSNIVATVPKPTPKFWIYLSRIAPQVSEDEVASMVRECLDDSDPIVEKLVKKDSDLSSFAFVSFKVGVSQELREKALDPSIWPKGIFFRVFDDNRTSQNFWRPRAPKVPRIDQLPPPQTPVTSVTPISDTPMT